MRRGEKGQALIEFVLILPILMLVLFAIVDFGRLFYEKISLENRFQEVLLLFEKDHNYDEALSLLNRGGKKATLETQFFSDYAELKVEMEFSFITPGLHRLLGNPYVIRLERTIPYEEEIDTSDTD